MNKFSILLILILPALLLTGCLQYKKTAYFQDVPLNANVPVKKKASDTAVVRDSTGRVIDTSGKNVYLVRIQPFDVLDITIKSAVSSFDAIFSETTATTGSTNNISVPSNGYYLGYTTDGDGYLNLPIIGKIYVKNLTLGEAATLITESLRGYVVEPYVKIKFLAFKVSVLGEVKLPGQLFVPNEKANLLDALSMAGDLTDYGNRKQIQIIRGSLQNPTTYTIDLTSIKCLKSEGYTIQPNDIIYVKPLKRKFLLTNLSTIVGILSLINITIAVLAITTRL